jgi:hypothetical protein
MAMILLFGPLPAALGGIAGGLAATLVQRITDLCRHRHRATCLVERALFNMAALGLAFLVSGAVYTASGGTTGDVALSSPLPVALAAASAEVVNSALVVAVASLQTGSPFFPIWRENVSWASPMNVLGMVVGGGGLAVGYRIAGALGAGVFFLSVAMTTYAYRLNVWQTKAQMACLEDMVAQRIEELRENWMKAEAT